MAAETQKSGACLFKQARFFGTLRYKFPLLISSCIVWENPTLQWFSVESKVIFEFTDYIGQAIWPEIPPIWSNMSTDLFLYKLITTATTA